MRVLALYEGKTVDDMDVRLFSTDKGIIEWFLKVTESDSEMEEILEG